jgi:hypothetical protein
MFEEHYVPGLSKVLFSHGVYLLCVCAEHLFEKDQVTDPPDLSPRELSFIFVAST